MTHGKKGKAGVIGDRNEYFSEYYKKNRERRNTYTREWYKAHPEAKKEQNARYRAKVKSQDQ